MFNKIIDPKKDGSTGYTNAGSCESLVNYLCKEDDEKQLDKEWFFNHGNDKVFTDVARKEIDDNAVQIAKGEARFYSLVIAPTAKEMEHLHNDKTELKKYVRDVMDIYAQNFNHKNGTSKNLTGNDLVYVAKLEDYRYYKGTDEEVVSGQAKQGDKVPGNNIHVHIIVSRRDKSLRHKLSPLVNDKKLFSREDYKVRCCTHFDKKYKYQGSGEHFDKYLARRDGTPDDIVAYTRKGYEQRQDAYAQKKVAGDERTEYMGGGGIYVPQVNIDSDINKFLSAISDNTQEEGQMQDQLQQLDAIRKKKRENRNRPRL